MAQFNVLSKEREIFGNYFIEASAGTGKTFTIEHLVVRFLLESSLELKQILVVTFTKAATRELKKRIYTNIQQALEQEAKWEYLKEISQEQRDKLEEALLLFDEAQIFTIHGFCQRMLQEFAFETGLSFYREAWTQEEEREAFFSFFRKQELEEPFFLLFKRYGNDIGKIADEVLTRKCKHRVSYKEKIDQLRKELALFAHLPLRELFLEAVPHYKKCTSPAFFEQADFLDNFLKKTCWEEKEIQTLLLQTPHFLERLDSSMLKVKSVGYTLDSRLAQLQKHLLPILEDLRNVDFILDRLAFQWEQEKKKNEEKFSPDDLLEKMVELLSNPQFCSAISQKYEAVIIDEFQDTDEEQWNIFESLFLKKEKKAVYLVGDPKQSIYAFRNADIYTFLSAASKFSQVYHLDTNFRSEEGLIYSLNKLFCKKEWISLPFLKKHLEVAYVKPSKEGEGKLHFMVVEEKEELFFSFILQEIQKENLPLDKVAILVKDRFQAKRLFAFLQSYNVPVTLPRGESLADCAALDSLEELIVAVVTLKKSDLKKAILGRLIGGKKESIEGVLFLENKEKFIELKQIFQEKGFGAFWAHFLRSSWKVEERIVSFPHLRFYHDLLEIIEKIIEEKEEERILLYLRELRKKESAERVLSLGEGVQIMSVHASKGLEFDTVFALGVAARSEKEEDEEKEAEKMRQLYVALTRAKKRLYIPLFLKRDPKKSSPIETFWDKTSPNLSDYEHTFLDQIPFKHNTFLAKKEVLIKPDEQEPLDKKKEYLLSFSSLVHKVKGESTEKKPAENILPLGKETGMILHRILERVLQQEKEIEEIITQEVEGTILADWVKEIALIIDKTLSMPLPSGFCLKEVEKEKMHHEMEFFFSQKEGVIKGFIDFWFEKGGKYFLVDWKTHYLESYDQESLKKVMQEEGYFLQASLYKEAMIRYLKIFHSSTEQELFGGIFYVFVRGPAVYSIYS